MFHDSPETLARMQGINGFVGLSNTFEFVRDKMINVQFSRHAFVHQHGDIPTGLESTKGSS